jgi:acyl-CoA hydrolase
MPRLLGLGVSDVHYPAAVEPKPPSTGIMSRWMGPGDANSAGNVHGGVIMHIADEVAGIAAVRHCGNRVVTAALDRMSFLTPVYIGQLLTLRATVNAAWRSSMEVGVRVEAEHVRTGEVVHAVTTYVTLVALDDEGNPTVVPPLDPRTPDELRRQREAELRRSNRLAERERIAAERAAEEG